MPPSGGLTRPPSNPLQEARRPYAALAMIVADALAAAERRLTRAGVPTPGVDAALLLRHVAGWSAADLVLFNARAVPPAVLNAFDAAVERRGRREPLQLIVGSVGFRYLEVEVRAGVFIPRPETEVLAGEAIARVPAGGVVVEPCTGTGAVACAVATESEAARVVATDVSEAAVALATVNAARCGAATVEVEHGDLLEPVDPALRGAVDVLVSNPPYVAAGETAGLEPEVTEWDPRQALVSGPTGHEVSDRLISAAARWLRPGGWLLLEVGETRANETARRCRAAGLAEADVVADLTGRDRVVAARRPGAARLP
jgi:release factor glutamine methyltransferase